MSLDTSVENLLRQDRIVTLGGLATVTLLAWIYLFSIAGNMSGAMSQMAVFKPWSALDALLMFIMWSVMMIGMMVPSAAPVILLYARVCRRQGGAETPLVPTGSFAAGYIAAWTSFSLVATALQWGFDRAALLSPMMTITSPFLGGLLLITAGIYQWLPYKNACLKHCRSPIDFLSTHWRHGAGGAFTMGFKHGFFCLGCCWALMILLFVGGVMNLLWVAAIAAFVLVEKAVPYGRSLGRVGAVAMIVAGAAVIAGG